MAAISNSQGAAVNTPWSGHWWPTNEAKGPNMYDANGPLAQYDKYVQATRGTSPGARQWESQNRRTNDPALDWAGYCHAWSAASVLTRGAPAEGVTRNGVHFTQDQLEGLISQVYYEPTYQMLPGGVRSNTDNPEAAEYKDMNPAWMDYLLQYYLQQNNFPLIMDTAAGAQVWNFPAFAYQSQRQAKQDGSVDVTTRVWFSDAAQGERGTRNFYKDYSYNLRNTGDGRMTGAWTGASKREHPDFAWVPMGKAEGGNRNPKVSEQVVEEILGYQI